MNIAIFCAFDTPATIEFAKATIAYLENKGHHLTLDQRLSTHLPEKAKAYDAFDAHATIDTKNDYLFSIGGDGTLLRSITFVKDTEIPILGINTGRLGFLTSPSKRIAQRSFGQVFC